MPLTHEAQANKIPRSVPFTASVIPDLANSTCSSPVDWFHINAAQKVGSSNYLVSGRYTNTVYYIDGSGAILWQLNGVGQNSSFAMYPDTPSADFRYGHDTRISQLGGDSFEFSMFNNNELSSDQPNPPTELVLYELRNAMGNSSRGLRGNATAVLKRKIVTDPPEYISAQGSYQSEIGLGHQFGTYGVDSTLR